MPSDEIIYRLNRARYLLYGSITSELGHEINNHLNSISLSSQLMDLYAQSNMQDELLSKLTIINNNLEAIQNFTQKMVFIKDIINIDFFQSESFEIIYPHHIIRAFHSSFGKLNRFDKVKIEASAITEDFYIKANIFIIDLFITIILMDLALLLKTGIITIQPCIEGEQKGMVFIFPRLSEFLSQKDKEIHLTEDGFLIGFKLINDTLSLFGGELILEDIGDQQSFIKIIYS